MGADREAAELAIPTAPEPYPILFGGSCAFRRDVFLQLGGYDAGSPYGIEDNDLALRAQSEGFRIAKHEAMQFAYRTRTEAEQSAVRAFHAGQRHLLLAHRYSLFGKSPSLRRGWYFELLRCAVAALVMVGQPARRDWAPLRSRAAMALGMLCGQVRYGWLRGIPERRIGAGLAGTPGAADRAVGD